jgi:adenosylhomocysteine nucleosidase
MSMITVLTGMTDEADILAGTPGLTVLCGPADRANLRALVPPGTQGLVSFGVCGGLSPQLQVADLVFGTAVANGTVTPRADREWFCTMAGHLIFRHYCAPVYSTGQEGGNTPAERHHLFSEYGTWTIDDESLAVATVATEMGLPFAVVRSVSDTYLEPIPAAIANATNPDGSCNLAAVIAAIEADPDLLYELARVALNFELALGALRGAWWTLQPNFLKT